MMTKQRVLQQRGFTLAEVMVAAAISGVALTVVFSLMTGQIQGYRRQEQVSEAGQNARISMEYMLPHLQRGGFGLPGKYLLPVTIRNNVAAGESDNTCEGTDVLEVRYREREGFWKYTSASASSISMTVPAKPRAASGVNPGWASQQRIFVFGGVGFYGLGRVASAHATDTTTPGSAIVQALVAADSSELAAAGVTTPSDSNIAEVDTVQVARFRVTCVNAGHPTLVFEDDTIDPATTVQSSQVVAPEIEDLQVAYLIDTDEDNAVTDTDAYNTPTAATGPNLQSNAAKLLHVKGVRISIVARSAETVPTANNPAPTLEDHTPTGLSVNYTRRVLREVVVFENRNTAEPDSYNHLTNGAL